MDWQGEVLGFWFALEPEQWWTRDANLDRRVRERFLPLWAAERENVPAAFLGTCRDALAAVILFDQFPRNMFRDHADQFSTDMLALAVAKGAVERGYDAQVPPGRRPFFYMPFEHSEDLADQERSLLLFTALGDDYLLGFARKHRDIIARFGRFPHRNALLGRAPRADELAAGNPVPW
ncbi:MAG: DUF924 domain-containing protein [Alphaproteobacteria bacterium]|nr:DUF924 domain-containing protein [Alphaproteobacteria bacterium]